jgi:hypothetical protein
VTLDQKVKIALDETRTLILGAQILLGFGFRAVFQDAFEKLPPLSRHLEAGAIVCTILTVACLIAPDPMHRIAYGGNDSESFHALVTRMADCALLPFAAGLGFSFYVVTARLYGDGAGLAAGLVFGALALAAWYGVGYARRMLSGRRKEARRRRSMPTKTPLEQRILQMMTECRVVLPGVQALLGFQLAIVITDAFERIPGLSKALHGASTGLSALSVVLLMVPAAYHRIVFDGEDAEEVDRVGGWCLTASTVPLAFAIAGDLYVVMERIGGSVPAIVAAGSALLVLIGFWHALPVLARRRLSR